MKRYLLTTVLLISCFGAVAQADKALAAAFKKFEADPQLKSGIASLYVAEVATGKVVFQKNATLGMAPASTQKIITAATAYELLGKEYRYKTEIGYSGTVEAATLKGDIILRGSGDPTLGSWRWKATSDSALLNQWVNAIGTLGVKSHQGHIYIDKKGWEFESIPNGWTWEDIGNYYGAGAGSFNWRENQYDILLASGNEVGSAVTVASTRPIVRSFQLTSAVTAAARGTGDNAYVYYPLGNNTGLVRGTIPVGEKAFSISAAYPDAVKEFTALFRQALSSAGIGAMKQDGRIPGYRVLDTHYSPVLDSMIYWFNRRSINLYGEALVKTIAFQSKEKGSTEEGVKLLKDHWKSKGIDVVELNMVDGSGLSPLNRVTTRAQVAILQYAKKQSWYPGFYLSLPEFNGMKMKSGTIRGVKGFCGYHRSKSGKEYVFSFLVNNYNGSSSAIVQKMYKVLDELK